MLDIGEISFKSVWIIWFLVENILLICMARCPYHPMHMSVLENLSQLPIGRAAAARSVLIGRIQSIGQLRGVLYTDQCEREALASGLPYQGLPRHGAAGGGGQGGEGGSGHPHQVQCWSLSSEFSEINARNWEKTSISTNISGDKIWCQLSPSEECVGKPSLSPFQVIFAAGCICICIL